MKHHAGEGDAAREPASVAAQRRADRRGDAVALLRATGIVAAGYGIGASLQSAYVYAQVVPAWEYVSVWARISANLVAVVVLVAVLGLLRAYLATRWWQVMGAVVAASAAAAWTRYGAQMLSGVYDAPDVGTRDAEIAAGFFIAVISSSIGMWGLYARRTARRRTRAAERDAVLVELAVQALEQEEIRVRREVAEGLHGTLQQKLVLVDARLRSVLRHAADGPIDGSDVEALEWVRAELDEARRIDVREMSRLLYPDRLELGLVPALRALLGGLPASIATRLEVSDAVRVVDDPAASRLTMSERLLAVRVVEEGVTNALKHGPASSIGVRVDVDGTDLVVAVENDGDLYDAASAGAASGTARLGRRLALVGGRVDLQPGRERGAILTARLPLGAETS